MTHYIISFEYSDSGERYEQDALLTLDQAAVVRKRLQDLEGEFGEPINDVDVSHYMPPQPISYEELVKELDGCLPPGEVSA